MEKPRIGYNCPTAPKIGKLSCLWKKRSHYAAGDDCASLTTHSQLRMAMGEGVGEWKRPPHLRQIAFLRSDDCSRSRSTLLNS